MAKRRIAIIALVLCLCLMPLSAFAVSTTDAKTPIDTEKACSLTISYGYGETLFPGQRVKLYKVADVSADSQYTLTKPFATSGLILNGVQTNGEWDTIRTTLEACVLADSIAETATAVTDALGQAKFSQLTPGLYLASGMVVAETCSFESALVALPGLDAESHWQYAVTVAAKPDILTQPDADLQMKVLKLWQGDEGRTDRPRSIEVEIFRNGESYETITLSEENHWSYTWTAKDDGSIWNVVERVIPKGYTVTVAEQDTTFVLTNIRNTPGNPPPATGDSANILLYVVLMLLSGGMLIILSILGKRKSQ